MAYINKEAAIKAIVEHPSKIAVFTGKAIQAIQELPTADVMEVVRCKDCIHYGEVGDCEVHPYDDRFNVNYFCADGERKDT